MMPQVLSLIQRSFTGPASGSVPSACYSAVIAALTPPEELGARVLAPDAGGRGTRRS